MTDEQSKVMRRSEFMTLVNVTYRQLDYWIRMGVDIGGQNGRGSGFYRFFTEEDVRVVNFLNELEVLLPDGHNTRSGLRKTDILRNAATSLKKSSAFLDADVIYVDVAGWLSLSPRHGWCLIRKHAAST